ncbi:PAS domain-containing protein [Hymenobacter sp. BT770]|uniref:PAS domain-containing protein n=1 Tax=Hymenobacter sp. BT770 TaxID=2886942 RepID=UPI001D0FDFF9|nr:PAS domain-containing protein [Hymenobacter sp. BT770]MCC3152780.1 PAS domain-containing protein [Hymenobacter sp. BT770]MDO3414855.1 PAS domain-containing protein [Hymenobacter sp. BT770]
MHLPRRAIPSRWFPPVPHGFRVPLSRRPALLPTLLAVSLTAVMLLRPVYGPDGEEMTDFTLDYLNHAAQRILGLPEQPGTTARTRFPEIVPTGIFDFYRRAFGGGAAETFDVNYQADGLDNYYHLAAQRCGEVLVVSFTDTANQPRTPVEIALRESQAAEQAARAEAQRQRFYDVLMTLPAQVATYHGPDLIYNFVSPRYQRYFGTHVLLGRSLREVLPELEDQGVAALLDRVYQTGEPYHGQEVELWLDSGGGGPRQQVFLNPFFYPLRDAGNLARVEELPVAGLVSKPHTKEKLDTILKLHFQRQFLT